MNSHPETGPSRSSPHSQGVKDWVEHRDTSSVGGPGETRASPRLLSRLGPAVAAWRTEPSVQAGREGGAVLESLREDCEMTTAVDPPPRRSLPVVEAASAASSSSSSSAAAVPALAPAAAAAAGRPLEVRDETRPGARSAFVDPSEEADRDEALALELQDEENGKRERNTRVLQRRRKGGLGKSAQVRKENRWRDQVGVGEGEELGRA
uniref:Uncharacterized protein n=1 Tax=Chromera velia CCMP2878 TaxID=1169474 RepID=A0A0G4HIK7_9ALVE|eukprot:Cvel_27997.t1-p1 / transcript=Cvel_27997.t1 / gene=Cvel_27997 / organism=Chromera_velia_CCMP2878 / gene_product=hypothetical protein / transcript_product=hypothetical protein / location=Cvel_scaffold3588:10172-11229(+) / protein_length=207 / sequence_SO=supercontig / SO=protein_coding / is_pseudo=false